MGKQREKLVERYQRLTVLLGTDGELSSSELILSAWLNMSFTISAAEPKEWTGSNDERDRTTNWLDSRSNPKYQRSESPIKRYFSAVSGIADQRERFSAMMVGP